ncbi:GNAT family N-acetyltransferase [Brucellaceae bacterium C25G]
MLQISPFTPLNENYTTLLDESVAQGQRMLKRLLENWHNGSNRFDKAGEMLVAGFVDGELAGVCGRNIDPYCSDMRQGRVRHLFVMQRFRRHGVGSALVRHIIADADHYFTCLNTNAPESAFAFYQNLGFKRVTDDPNVTHCYQFC